MKINNKPTLRAHIIVLISDKFCSELFSNGKVEEEKWSKVNTVKEQALKKEIKAFL